MLLVPAPSPVPMREPLPTGQAGRRTGLADSHAWPRSRTRAPPHPPTGCCRSVTLPPSLCQTLSAYGFLHFQGTSLEEIQQRVQERWQVARLLSCLAWLAGLGTGFLLSSASSACWLFLPHWLRAQGSQHVSSPGPGSRSVSSSRVPWPRVHGRHCFLRRGVIWYHPAQAGRRSLLCSGLAQESPLTSPPEARAPAQAGCSSPCPGSPTPRPL